MDEDAASRGVAGPVSDTVRTHVDEDAVAALAAELSGREAGTLARALGSGRTLTQTLGTLDAGRRRVLRPLMEAAGVGPRMRETSVLVLRAIEAARGRECETTPVWTMPERACGEGLSGSVTAALGRLVEGAYHSVTISTYNLAPSSGLWAAMTGVSSRPEVSVRLYMDADVADQGLGPQPHALSTLQAARRLERAVVLCPAVDDKGRRVRNHAKFLVVDHQILVVTSANLSLSAEERNVELGLRIDDPLLARAVEDQMRALEDVGIYERVGRKR